MPIRDPENMRHLVDFLPNLFAAALTFALSFTKGLKEGGPAKKSFLNALAITLLAIGLFPLFVELAARYELPLQVAFAPCVFLAAMGVDWFRAKADDIYDVFISWLRKK